MRLTPPKPCCFHCLLQGFGPLNRQRLRLRAARRSVTTGKGDKPHYFPKLDGLEGPMTPRHMGLPP